MRRSLCQEAKMGRGEKRERETYKEAELSSTAKKTVSEHEPKSPVSLLADFTEITL